MTFTVDQIIEKFVSVRDAIKTISERHAEELKPLCDRLAIFEQALLAKLNADNTDSVKTEHGTAYRSTVMSATVASAAPRGSAPASPMKTEAGWALYQRKPSRAPATVKQNTAR